MEIMGYTNQTNEAKRYIANDSKSFFTGNVDRLDKDRFKEIKEDFGILFSIDYKIISDIRSCASGVELDIVDISNGTKYKLKTNSINELLKMFVLKEVETNEDLIMNSVFTIKVRGREHVLEIVPTHKIKISRMYKND